MSAFWRLPALEPLLLGVGLAVDLDEREQLLQQAVAGELEGDDRALEALEELGADQADDLLLPVLLEGVDALVRPLVPGQRVVHRQGEQRVLPLRRPSRTCRAGGRRSCGSSSRDLRRLALREDGGLAGLADLALARVGPAALDDEVAGRSRPRRGCSWPRRCASATSGTSCPTLGAERLLHVVEVGAQVVDAERAGEVRLVAPREELGHVPEVAQPVVDRRGGEHEERLRLRTALSSRSKSW